DRAGDRGAGRHRDVAARARPAPPDRQPGNGIAMTTHDTNPPSERELVVHAYLDGELDPANALAVERDIAADPALAAERARMQALAPRVRGKLPPKPLPPHGRPRGIATVGLGRARRRPTWMAVAASVALAFLVGSGASFVLSQREGADQVVASI